MGKRETGRLIIESGLAIIAESGSHGMTMRGVANEAGISLSNLQYHFKDRDALLMGMIDYYLSKCAELSASILISLPAKEHIQKSDLESFLLGLFDNESLHELCKTFREIWAISTRNEVIKQYLDTYYVKSSSLLAQAFRHLVDDDSQLDKIITLLIPYFEGYSITSDAMPMLPGQTAALLADIVWAILHLEQTSSRDCAMPLTDNVDKSLLSQ